MHPPSFPCRCRKLARGLFMQRMLSSKVLTCLGSFKVRVEDATTLLLQHTGKSTQGHCRSPAHQQTRSCCDSTNGLPAAPKKNHT